MSDAECDAAMRSLEHRVRAYARLAVRQGVAVEKDQELVITAPVGAADFCRLVVSEGYKAGASHVTVIWTDDVLRRLEFQSCPTSYFETCPSWKVEQMNSLAAQGACFLWIDGDDPDGLKGIDPVKPATASRVRNASCKVWRHGLDFNQNAWSIIGVPQLPWARKVFPDLSDSEAMLRLWRAILDVSRVDDDPADAWATHDAAFEKAKRMMNGNHFDALHYQAANGTNLTIGMTAGHVWEGGSGRTTAGHKFFPNIPTEEVFTSPDRLRADGVVHAAMPLVHDGSVIRDFWLRFEGGRVVEYAAGQGQDVLRHIIETDDSSCRLGECALISKNTPIRESDLLFYSTLYDENASCHLALGTGFPECYEGGYDLTEDELLERGVNHSHTHVDFMIGTDDLAITGIKATGEEVPVFVHGQWAWE
ncbi:MAG: aminopeptidase [Atopobiaceae bacterium]|jgi:aminopeptidase|nr:aminopeptidase [Atopobiaceae bacterium]MCH4180820.1 aminopeptidase [Atopobiaceae bacterium]MCH4214137.1 aminopeptidase [Atopobiaceae bacterium]MCH4229689.1 aminopeptidase [Atopobiaceae bacterium]MCH4276489.1 aminopeptidase [Atopobiaceae bacterium]